VRAHLGGPKIYGDAGDPPTVDGPWLTLTQMLPYATYGIYTINKFRRFTSNRFVYVRIPFWGDALAPLPYNGA